MSSSSPPTTRCRPTSFSWSAARRSTPSQSSTRPRRRCSATASLISRRRCTYSISGPLLPCRPTSCLHPLTEDGRVAAVARRFQNSKQPQPCVFIVTYATAAVGITLTAATRVYLMEPSMDPAQEVQAAGRIHRLGQTKEIHIKRDRQVARALHNTHTLSSFQVLSAVLALRGGGSRLAVCKGFALKGTIDEAIAGLHDKVKSGTVTIVDKEFPVEVFEHFNANGVARPHKLNQNDQGTLTLFPGLFPGSSDWGRGYDDGRPACFDSSRGSYPPGARVPDRFGATYRTALCVCCGRAQSIDDSLEWWGTGNMSWLNGLRGCPRTALGSGRPKRPEDSDEARALDGNQRPKPAHVLRLLASATNLAAEAAHKDLAAHEVKESQARKKLKEEEGKGGGQVNPSRIGFAKSRLRAAKEEVETKKRKLEGANDRYQKALRNAGLPADETFAPKQSLSDSSLEPARARAFTPPPASVDGSSSSSSSSSLGGPVLPRASSSSSSSATSFSFVPRSRPQPSSLRSEAPPPNRRFSSSFSALKRPSPLTPSPPPSMRVLSKRPALTALLPPAPPSKRLKTSTGLAADSANASTARPSSRPSPLTAVSAVSTVSAVQRALAGGKTPLDAKPPAVAKPRWTPALASAFAPRSTSAPQPGASSVAEEIAPLKALDAKEIEHAMAILRQAGYRFQKP